jgi:hypothetical protein
LNALPWSDPTSAVSSSLVGQKQRSEAGKV